MHAAVHATGDHPQELERAQRLAVIGAQPALHRAPQPGFQAGQLAEQLPAGRPVIGLVVPPGRHDASVADCFRGTYLADFRDCAERRGGSQAGRARLAP